MIRSAAISIIKRGLGFRQTQDSAIIAALQQAQRDVELGQTLPNWLLVFDQPITVTSGTATATLPTGFIRFHDDYPVYYLSGVSQIFLPRRNAAEAYQAYVASGDPEDDSLVLTSGTYPSVFALRNKTTVQFYPTPTVAMTVYATYYKAAVVLDADVENAWLANAPNYLIGLAGTMVAADLRDKGAMEKFGMMAKIGQRGLIGDIVEDELAGRPLVMGRNN
jgi:hypothetical protein